MSTSLKYALYVLAVFLLLVFARFRYRSLVADFSWKMKGYSKRYSPEKYEALKFELQEKQEQFRAEYALMDVWGKAKIKEKLAKEFTKQVEAEIFPFWYGTRYDFNGMTQVPRQGKIACGYFVTTVLRDAGAPLERIRLAQITSEEMIQNLVAETNIERFSNTPIVRFTKVMEQMGNGLYVVGLDTHAGFLLVEGQEVYFIHSSGRAPWGVVKEEAIKSGVLTDSKYRVVGKLTQDDQFLERWLRDD